MPFFLVSTLCSIESLILSFDDRDYCVPCHSNAFQNGAHSVGSIVWTIVGRGHSIIDVPQLSAMSFVAALKNTLEYIVAAIDDDDSNRAEVVQQQVDHLLSVFRNKVPTTEDATKSLNFLKKDNIPSTPDQRDKLRRVIREVGCSGAPSPVKTVITNKTQTCVCFENYLTEDLWTRMLDPSVGIDAMLESITDLMCAIGLHHPNEKPTQQWIVAMLFAAKRTDGSRETERQREGERERERE